MVLSVAEKSGGHAKRANVLSISHGARDRLAADRRGLDERIQDVSGEIEIIASQDPGRKRLMTVPRIGPIISGTMIRLAQSRERPISTAAPTWSSENAASKQRPASSKESMRRLLAPAIAI